MSHVPLKVLQRLVGKCVAFSLAVPAVRSYTILHNAKPIPLTERLKHEISHWLFLKNFDDPLPWRDERHVRISIATDASNSGGKLLSATPQEASDYWTADQNNWDIATKEAAAIVKVLTSFRRSIKNAHVDLLVDNQAVNHAWNNQGSRSPSLNDALKSLFLTTVQLNLSLHLMYIPTHSNPADRPSRRISLMGSSLTAGLWHLVQTEFGGTQGRSVDLMALDSNAQPDLFGNALPHFTSALSPASAGINLFSQDLLQHQSFMRRPYVFPPSVLVGPVFKGELQPKTKLVLKVVS